VATAGVTDGRSARSQRTRTAVVDALLALLREGNLRPTAREIAARAEVSLRSVYVHFDDLEDLFLAVARRQLALIEEIFVEVPGGGSLRERAEHLVAVRARIYEETAGVRRAAALQAPFSENLSRRIAAVRERGRADLARVFAPELDSFHAAERDRRVTVADLLTSADAWDRLRLADELTVAQATDAVVVGLVAILEAV
jgi:AcrR family transcriptional regulator